VTDFEESEQSEDFSLLWRDLGASLDSDNEEIWTLFLDEKLVFLEGLSFLLNELSGFSLERLHVLSALLVGVVSKLLGFLGFANCLFSQLAFHLVVFGLFLLKTGGDCSSFGHGL
jgi:hypothetical protein